jgi:hypothetical protein
MHLTTRFEAERRVAGGNKPGNTSGLYHLQPLPPSRNFSKNQAKVADPSDGNYSRRAPEETPVRDSKVAPAETLHDKLKLTRGVH